MYTSPYECRSASRDGIDELHCLHSRSFALLCKPTYPWVFNTRDVPEKVMTESQQVPMTKKGCILASGQNYKGVIAKADAPFRSPYSADVHCHRQFHTTCTAFPPGLIFDFHLL